MSSTSCLTMLLTTLVPAADAPLYTFTASPEPTALIAVDASRAGPPITRRTFGKFCEHLHRNIYHGMWAQIVRNTGFEDWWFFFSNDERLKQARAQAAGRGKPWREGFAAQWQPAGRGDVTYRLDRDCVNAKMSQHVTVKSLETDRVGLEQDSVYFPLHRESDYLVSVSLRARGIESITLTVRYEGRELGTVRLRSLGGSWAKHEGRLHLAADVVSFRRARMNHRDASGIFGCQRKTVRRTADGNEKDTWPSGPVGGNAAALRALASDAREPFAHPRSAVGLGGEGGRQVRAPPDVEGARRQLLLAQETRRGGRRGPG